MSENFQTDSVLNTNANNVVDKSSSSDFNISSNKIKTFTSEQVFLRLERKQKEYEIKLQQEIDAMLKKGIEPNPRADIFGPFCEQLSWNMRWLKEENNKIEFRVSSWNFQRSKEQYKQDQQIEDELDNLEFDNVQDIDDYFDELDDIKPNEHQMIWGSGWPQAGAILNARELLGFLAREWPILASNFLKQKRVWRAPVNFKTGLNRFDLSDFLLEIDDATVRIISGSFNVKVNSETIMVIESLRVLGDELAKGLAQQEIAESERLAWADACALDDLPPLESENFDKSIDYQHIQMVAEFWAKKLEINVQDYELAAIWEHSNHLAYGLGDRSILPVEPWSGIRAAIDKRLPNSARVLAFARKVHADLVEKKISDESFEDWNANIVSSQNMDMRGCYFYSKWPERSLPYSKSERYEKHFQDLYGDLGNLSD